MKTNSNPAFLEFLNLFCLRLRHKSDEKLLLITSQIIHIDSIIPEKVKYITCFKFPFSGIISLFANAMLIPLPRYCIKKKKKRNRV
ncbi:MAG: hypothetical protein VZQ29_07105, partial [Succiniclasticum sp.]|nr:hypothetical protein [Succiniclasticum sp.]